MGRVVEPDCVRLRRIVTGDVLRWLNPDSVWTALSSLMCRSAFSLEAHGWPDQSPARELHDGKRINKPVTKKKP